MHKNSEIQFRFHVIKINVRMVSQGKDKRVVLFCSALKQGSPPNLMQITMGWPTPSVDISIPFYISLFIWGRQPL